MIIQDLKTSITEMSNEDAIQLVLNRRESRLTPKKKPKKNKVEIMSLDDVIDGMNAEQLKEFYEKLKES